MNEKEQMDLKKINIECDLLELQKKNFDKTPKKLIAITTIAITIITTIISLFSYFNNKSNKELELQMKREEINKAFIQKEIDVELKLITFFLENYDKFFSENKDVIKRMSKVIATLPSKHTNEFLKKIIELSDSSNQKIWKKTQQKIEKIEKQSLFELTIQILKNNKPLTNINVSLSIDKLYQGITSDNGIVSFKLNSFEVGKLYTIIVDGKKFYEPINKSITINI